MTMTINFKDRTQEFYNLAERIKKRGVVQIKRQGTPKLATTAAASSRSEFARMAAQLGSSIASTSEKLEQLTYCKFLPYLSDI
jgi:syntaxin 5